MPAFVQYGAGSIELIGGALVMIGLLTSWAAFLCSGTMAAAYWMAHGTKALLPIQNGGELAVLYCFVFLLVSARGSGIWSVDATRGGGVKMLYGGHKKPVFTGKTDCSDLNIRIV